MCDPIKNWPSALPRKHHKRVWSAGAKEWRERGAVVLRPLMGAPSTVLHLSLHKELTRCSFGLCGVYSLSISRFPQPTRPTRVSTTVAAVEKRPPTASAVRRTCRRRLPSARHVGQSAPGAVWRRIGRWHWCALLRWAQKRPPTAPGRTPRQPEVFAAVTSIMMASNDAARCRRKQAKPQRKKGKLKPGNLILF